MFLFVILPIILQSIIFDMFWIVYISIVYYTCGILYWLTHLFFSRLIFPFYIKWLTRGDKFLIRFDEQKLPDVTQRRQRWNHAGQMSKTSVFLLIFFIALFAQSNITTATTGEGIEAYRCPDGTVEVYASNCDLVDDPDAYPVCTDGCVDELSARDKVLQTFFSLEVLLICMLSPYLTAIAAPLIVMKYSALAVVDKKKKSISPIGEKLSVITNAAMGFGAVVVFAKTLYGITQYTATNQNFDNTSLGMIKSTLTMLVVMIWLFYPAIWMANAKFAKFHPGLVRDLDRKITVKSDLKVHSLEHTSEGFTIFPTTR